MSSSRRFVQRLVCLEIALVLLGATGVASAQSASAGGSASSAQSSDAGSTQRVLSDPLFLPRGGQVLGATTFSVDRPTGTNTKNGVMTGSFQSRNNTIDQSVAYGISDRFTVRVGMGYADRSRDTTSAATGDVTVGNSNGLSDPTFSATYRLFDQPDAPLVVDLTGSYSPDAIAAKSSGGGLDGNVGRGGQNAGATLGIGRQMAGFTVAGSASATYVGEQDTDLLANGATTRAEGHWSYDLGLNTQTRFTDRFSVNAGLGFGSAAHYDVLNLSTNAGHTYDPPTTLAINAALNYHFVPNRLVASFTYTYDTYTDAQNVFATATQNTAVKDRHGNVFGGRLLFTF